MKATMGEAMRVPMCFFGPGNAIFTQLLDALEES